MRDGIKVSSRTVRRTSTPNRPDIQSPVRVPAASCTICCAHTPSTLPCPLMPACTNFLTHSPHLPCVPGRRLTRELSSPGHCTGGFGSQGACWGLVCAARAGLLFGVWVLGGPRCCACAIGPDVRFESLCRITCGRVPARQKRKERFRDERREIR